MGETSYLTARLECRAAKCEVVHFLKAIWAAPRAADPLSMGDLTVRAIVWYARFCWVACRGFGESGSTSGDIRVFLGEQRR